MVKRLDVPTRKQRDSQTRAPVLSNSVQVDAVAADAMLIPLSGNNGVSLSGNPMDVTGSGGGGGGKGLAIVLLVGLGLVAAIGILTFVVVRAIVGKAQRTAV